MRKRTRRPKLIKPSQQNIIPARTGIYGGTRACLCRDRDTYSIECCDGSIWAQGIGVISRTQ